MSKVTSLIPTLEFFYGSDCLPTVSKQWRQRPASICKFATLLKFWLLLIWPFQARLDTL